MITTILKQDNIEDAIQALKKGEVIAFPTETVFGLGVVFDDENAYHRLVSIKNRPPTQPFTLMCGDVNDIKKYAYVDSQTETLIKAFMPGQLTLILRVKEDVPPMVTLGTGFIGIRVSELKFVQDMIRRVGKPLLVPSANKHGDAPALNHEEALLAFKGDIPYIIEGQSISHIPSTIIKIDDKIELIREGMIPFSRIKDIVRSI